MKRKKPSHIKYLIAAIAAVFVLGILSRQAPNFPDWYRAIVHAASEAPEQALSRLIAEGQIINAHEHIESIENVPDLLAVMDRLGIRETVLVGSSNFTLTMNDSVGFTGYDENNAELLRIVEKWPGRFEAWPTVNPLDPEKLMKFQLLHEQGASGVKLYAGHGYTRRDNGKYMFHPIAMDDPDMFPLYEYCEDHFIPLCFHVNPYKPGFAEEFVAVLSSFPDMKVIAPHYILSSIQSSRLREYLETFPNLYSDISYGHDDFIKAGLTRISKDPDKFRDIFYDYPDRFFFGSDMVLTLLEGKDTDWMAVRVQAYYDSLTKETYTTPVIPGETLTGLELTEPYLGNILVRNFPKFMALKPEGTKITRKIDWSKMGVDKLDRYPGQAFPPVPKSK